MTDATRDLGTADGHHNHQDGHWRRSRPVPLPTQRKRLEAAVEAALAAVEAAVVELDLLDGDSDMEPACEDEGAQCEDEGAGDDREPDQDGDGMPERSWQIGGREVRLIDGADRSWAERYGHDDHTSTSRLHDGGGVGDCHDGNTLDLDDAPDPLQPSRLGYGCVR